MQRFNSHPTHQLQRGSALIISLVLLTIITLAAIIGMQRSSLQLKMVANLQFHQALFTTAQNSLSHAVEKVVEADKDGTNSGTLKGYLKALEQQANKVKKDEDEEDEEEEKQATSTDEMLLNLVGNLPEPLSGIKKENIKIEGRRLERRVPKVDELDTEDIRQAALRRIAIKVTVKDNSNNKIEQEVGLEYNSLAFYGN